MNNDEEILVPVRDRTIGGRDLFFNWFAANIGIMGIVFGAIVVSYRLSFFQAVLASLVGALSFLIVGWVAVIGDKAGMTTFKMSRAAFGLQGNKIPNGVAWINMVGWLAINIVTGTLLLVALFDALHIPRTTFSTAAALVVFSACVLLSGLLKERAIARIQTWLSYLFGILTLFILVLLVMKTQWSEVWTMESGSWVGGFLPAVSIVAAGSGISWSMNAADWGTYVKPETSPHSTFWNTTLGGAVPLFLLMVAGVLLSTAEPGLASADNPFEAMYRMLPSWIAVIYFLVAAGGLIPQCIISLRSARINLLTLGIHVSQRTSLAVHGLIVVLIPVFVLFISGRFLTNFQMFLGLLGILLGAWVAVFLADSVLNRQNGNGYRVSLLVPETGRRVNWRTIVSWLAAVAVGFMFTNNALFTGPFARGIFRDNSLGVLLSGVVAAACFWLLNGTGEKDFDHEKNESQ